MDESESEMEIKPTYVGGNPVCSFDKCPRFNFVMNDYPNCFQGFCAQKLRQQRNEARAENKRLKAEVEALKSGAIAELEKLYGRCCDHLLDKPCIPGPKQQDVPPLIKAELGCMTCRNASRKITETYCDDCKLRDGSNGSKWQPLKHEGETHE